MVDTETASRPTVAVVGSYNVGLTMRVPRFPVPGETVIGSEFEEGAGGKGSNQAIAVARLGAEALFVGRVGADKYAEDARALWDREGVATEYVEENPDVHTGAGFVIVDEDGENEITVAPGANDTLSAADVREAAEAIERADVLLLQMEIPDEAIRTAVEIADDDATAVVLNPAPAREIPEEVLAGVDYLTPNQNEARVLASGDPDDPRSDRDIADELLELGVRTVVMTRGADGALVVDGREETRVPSPAVDARDTTGAGDAFNGAFAVAVARNDPVPTAVEFACAAGAHATTEREVIPGLPTREAVESLLSI